MADVFLGKDFQAKTFPFRQAVPFDVSANSAVPWGQAIVNESFESQAIGAGNTGTLNIDVELPSDYVSMLRSLHIGCSDPSAVNWKRGVVGFAYQQPGGPYKTSVNDFPEKEYLWWGITASYAYAVRDRFSTDVNYVNWDIGLLSGSGGLGAFNPYANSPTQVPLWIPPQTDANLQGRSLIIYLENDTASSAANNFVFNAVFYLYTLEQAYASGVMSSPRVF
jgi:hypothetical protein